MELSEQLGSVPRGLSDATFTSLGTTLFRELGPDILAMSPPPSSARSIISASSSQASPRVNKRASGKWSRHVFNLLGRIHCNRRVCDAELHPFLPSEVCQGKSLTSFYRGLVDSLDL